MSGKLADRIALVTGASRGIGWAAARALAKEGAHVIAVARTTGGLEELDDAIQADGGSATLVPLDLKDGEGIDRLGGSIFERWKRLDIMLVNAAVLGPISPLGHVEPEKWDEVMAINVTASWRLIRSMDPLLRQSDAGRALFVTSGAAFNCKAYWGPYSVSKAALNALVRTYAAENRITSVKANLINPGPMRTAMRARAMPGEDPSELPEPAELAPAILRLSDPSFEQSGVMYDFPTDKIIDLSGT